MKKELWLVMSGALLMLAAALFVYRERRTYQCPNCTSEQHVFQWHIGSWTSANTPLSEKQIVIQPSFAFTAFSGTNHAHTWVFAQGSPYYLFGTKWGGCAIGPGRHQSDFAGLFESSADFREFVFGRIASSKCTTNEIVNLIRLPHTRSLEETNTTTQIAVVQSKKLIDEFFEKP